MKNDFLTGLAWAAAMIGTALAASYARAQGYVGEDTVLRVVAMNGLMIAFYGNRMPKMLVPNACARQVLRVGGWAMVLGGIVYAGMFAFAPIPLAIPVGVTALTASIAVTVGYGLWLRARTKAA